MRRRLLMALVMITAVGLASCSASDVDPGAQTTEVEPPPAIASPSTSTAATTTVETSNAVAPETVVPEATAPATAVTPEARAIELCSYETTFVLGQIQNSALDEASGLIASRDHLGVIWSHNDGAEMPGLFAIAPDGRDLGFHPLEISGVDDVEDIAMVDGGDGSDGNAGDDILLADIGDNSASRPSIRIYRFSEPDPGVAAPISEVEVLEFVYPDRAHNAETLLVDQANDRIVIVTKQQRLVDGVPPEFGQTAPSSVFEGPLAGHGSGPIELLPAGELDMPALESRTVAAAPNPISLLGFGGLPTGGDISPDAALIALRTYETVWVWPHAAERSVAESFASDPCQVRVASETQGEAVTFFGDSLITLSEGVNQTLFGLRP